MARNKVDAGLLDDVLEAKREALRTDGLLETVKRDTSFTDVAGLQGLRDWIGKRKSALTPEGQRFGLVPPKACSSRECKAAGRAWRRAPCGEWATNWRGWMPGRCTTSSWREREAAEEGAGPGAEDFSGGAVD